MTTTDDSLYVAFDSTQEPLTKVQYIAEIEKAIVAVERGDIYSDEELMYELETEF